MNASFINANPETEFFPVSSAEFAPYGRLIDVDCRELTKAAGKIGLPSFGSVYLPSVAEFEELSVHKYFSDEIYGEMPVQTGFCCGHNSTLGALEWHKSSEVNVAVTDFVLLLGKLCDVKNGKYDSSDIKAFYVRKGQCIEVYATTLHFCPCQVTKDGFGCVVVLPKGTNVPLDRIHKDPLLFRKNKWLIAHEGNTSLIKEKGAFSGITGENYTLRQG